MRKACCILLLVTLCVVCIACKASPSTSAGTGPSPVSELIAEADRLLASQDFDGAMERSLRALELSAENPLLQVQSLLSIVGIDIMASRDADAWDKAV